MTLPSRCRQGPEARAAACRAQVQWSVKYKASYGDRLHVVGDHEVLGKWKAQEGVKMRWVEGDIWKAEQVLSLDPGALSSCSCISITVAT
jgi:Starch binding domain